MPTIPAAVVLDEKRQQGEHNETQTLLSMYPWTIIALEWQKFVGRIVTLTITRSAAITREGLSRIEATLLKILG